MIDLQFPDGSIRQYAPETTGADIAAGISKSLAKKAVAYALDGELRDLSDAVGQGGTLEIITREDPRALELIRHDAAHVMAEAVQELWPGTQVTIGPVIENGFYYDFYRNAPFTPEDLPVIEKKMVEIIRRNAPFTKQVWTRDKARRVFADKGEAFKVELVDGAFHDVDSSALAFEIASRAALREALQKGGSVLLEPVMKVEVVSPEDYTGSVIGDLNSRRGQIQGQDMRGNANVITAMVPLANMFSYVNNLRSMSQGRATFTMQFDHYSEVPKAIADEVQAKYA